MRLLLSLISLCLATCQPVYAGYEAVVLPQIPQYVTVKGACDTPEELLTGASTQNCTQQWPNPAAHMMPVGVFCKPADFARHSADPAKRTVVVRNAQGTLTNAQVLAVCPKVLIEREDKLLKATRDYIDLYVSSIGVSVLGNGYALGLPKAVACSNWADMVWLEYLNRKRGLVDDLDTEPDLDFSTLGAMPFSIWDLKMELITARDGGVP